MGSVGDVTGFVLAAKEDGVFADLATAGCCLDLLAEKLDTFGAVLDGEGFFENVAESVATEGDVFTFCVIEGYAEYFAGRGRFLENSSDFDALLAVDGFCRIGFMFIHGHTRLKINLE